MIRTIPKTLAAAPLTAFAAQGAFADDDGNFVFINQDGADNVGDITQSGLHNQLGTAADPALQSGIYNKLTLTQAGSDNAVDT